MVDQHVPTSVREFLQPAMRYIVYERERSIAWFERVKR
jgi:hypothetical protein